MGFAVRLFFVSFDVMQPIASPSPAHQVQSENPDVNHGVRNHGRALVGLAGVFSFVVKAMVRIDIDRRHRRRQMPRPGGIMIIFYHRYDVPSRPPDTGTSTSTSTCRGMLNVGLSLDVAAARHSAIAAATPAAFISITRRLAFVTCCINASFAASALHSYLSKRYRG